ncbi:hypothetical protein [Candidatus Pelagibacter sp.]|uniref:hypothetical protein n=1 Tax=Candidatus Pelagibacter sp. TaxID=2024849 RepID=UPI003D12B9C0
MNKPRWHNIQIKSESFDELKQIQKQIPIRTSIPQLIEWLIKVGQNEIKSELQNDKQRI